MLKCFVACLFLEESQQPTWPQVKHIRRCTQVSPVFKQSSQPSADGTTLRILSLCVQIVSMIFIKNNFLCTRIVEDIYGQSNFIGLFTGLGVWYNEGTILKNNSMAFRENHARSIVKALTYRTVIIFSDSIIVYLVTRRVDVTFGFVAISNLASTAIYFLHERAWNNIHWGKTHIKVK